MTSESKRHKRLVCWLLGHERQLYDIGLYEFRERCLRCGGAL